MGSLIKIYEASSLADSILCSAILNESGIPVFARPSGNSVVSLSGVYALPPFTFALLVLPAAVERAEAIVAEYLSESATDFETGLPEFTAGPVEELAAALLIERYLPLRRRWFFKLGMAWVWFNIASFFFPFFFVLFSISRTPAGHAFSRIINSIIHRLFR